MLGCNESNIIFQQHLCKLGQLRRSNGKNSQVRPTGHTTYILPPHFCTFCELVEGKENKLTTFSTWTIMSGCYESNIIFQQHLCKLRQLRRSNELLCGWWQFHEGFHHEKSPGYILYGSVYGCTKFQRERERREREREREATRFLKKWVGLARSANLHLSIFPCPRVE